jgi:uncharacterized membrane protein
MDATSLLARLEELGAQERQAIAALVQKRRTAKAQAPAESRTFGQRLADGVAAFGGSWRFILLFLGGMALWITLNLTGITRFDAYPFILLNLALSCLAALQAPIIMMSQNRQAARDREEAHHDYEINLQAELEILALHKKLDHLTQLIERLPR